MHATKQSRYIPEIEGLRGCLAAWVFLFHASHLAGIAAPILSQGGMAVQVFMIVSGFVISRMHLRAAESYPRYLLRRAARIYPAYTAAIILGIAVSGIASKAYAMIPWAISGQDRLVERDALDRADFFRLLVDHVLMLHGILPDKLLPGASLAFVPAAWSLSLEWQFYILAPLMITVYCSIRLRVPALCLTVITVLFSAKYLNAAYIVPSFLPISVGFFALGIYSALIYDQLHKISANTLFFYTAILSVAAVSTTGLFWIPVIIWAWVVSASVNKEDTTFSVISRFLSDVKVKYFGDISYSFYLLHQAFLSVTAFILLRAGFHNKYVFFITLVVIAFPLAAIAASLSYRFIETPTNRLAKKIVAPAAAA